MSNLKTDDALVVFTPSGKRGYFAFGTSLLQAARQLGVDIDSVCGGRGICGRCKILVSEGEFAKLNIHSTSDNLEPITGAELKYAKRRTLETGYRLSCHARLQGNVVIDVPAQSQVHQQLVRKGVEQHNIQLNPLVHLYYIEVDEANLQDQSGDLRRLLQALEQQWHLKNLDYDVQLLATIQPLLRQSQWRVTVAIRENRQLIAIWPGFKDDIYGMAVDVGSTTVAAHLCSLGNGKVVASTGIMNPQIRFGEDLMSRVSYVMMNPGGEEELTQVIRQAINELTKQLCRQHGCDDTDIVEVVFVANPIMHHLLLGINPVELGGAPFALATDMAVNMYANQLQLQLNSQARAYLLPCIAGHVGADAAAMILAERPYAEDAMTLLVDVGTNAEIVLGNRHQLVACSSPTGPALEGAQISCGQRAAAGAIERVRIDADTLEPRFQVIGTELWSNQAGFEQAITTSGITGICGSGIIEVVAEMYLTGIINQDGVIDGAMAKRSSRIVADERTFAYVMVPASHARPALRILQSDIRAIQLAKAALYAGIRLLMEHQQVQQIDRIRLAGAFGSHIDVKYAMVLGLIPDCDLSQVSSAGNAAGTGARIALLDKHARQNIESVVRQIEKIETAMEASFQQHFVDAMAFPHKRDAFPNLQQLVKLPPIKLPKKSSSRKRRRY
jgi:uncharacterized 2Fe-2S/4Fe-4S cluster protein (DUF4445 family)